MEKQLPAAWKAARVPSPPTSSWGLSETELLQAPGERPRNPSRLEANLWLLSNVTTHRDCSETVLQLLEKIMYIYTYTNTHVYLRNGDRFYAKLCIPFSFPMSCFFSRFIFNFQFQNYLINQHIYNLTM